MCAVFPLGLSCSSGGCPVPSGNACADIVFCVHVKQALPAGCCVYRHSNEQWKCPSSLHMRSQGVGIYTFTEHTKNIINNHPKKSQILQQSKRCVPQTHASSPPTIVYMCMYVCVYVCVCMYPKMIMTLGLSWLSALLSQSAVLGDVFCSPVCCAFHVSLVTV